MRRHPVRWAWIAFLSIALLASAAIWTGAIGPSVDLRRDTFAAVEDRAAGTHQLALALRNTRRLPFEVTAVHAEAPGFEVVSVETGVGDDEVPRNPIGVREVHDRAPFAPFELDHDEERYIVFTVKVVDCAAVTANGPRPWVRIRSALGVERTEHLDGDQRAPTASPAEPYDFATGNGREWAWEISRAICDG